MASPLKNDIISLAMKAASILADSFNTNVKNQLREILREYPSRRLVHRGQLIQLPDISFTHLAPDHPREEHLDRLDGLNSLLASSSKQVGKLEMAFAMLMQRYRGQDFRDIIPDEIADIFVWDDSVTQRKRSVEDMLTIYPMARRPHQTVIDSVAFYKGMDLFT